MTRRSWEEVAQPAPRASHPGLRDFLEITVETMDETNVTRVAPQTCGWGCLTAYCGSTYRCRSRHCHLIHICLRSTIS